MPIEFKWSERISQMLSRYAFTRIGQKLRKQWKVLWARRYFLWTSDVQETKSRSGAYLVIPNRNLFAPSSCAQHTPFYKYSIKNTWWQYKSFLQVYDHKYMMDIHEFLFFSSARGGTYLSSTHLHQY